MVLHCTGDAEEAQTFFIDMLCTNTNERIRLLEHRNLF